MYGLLEYIYETEPTLEVFFCYDVHLPFISSTVVFQVFRAPWSPWVPSVGIAVSWVMMAQLSWPSLQWSLLGVVGVCIWYFTYG